METCKKFYENVILYMEGSLSEAQKEVFVSHLKECKECQSYLQYMNMLVHDRASDIDTDVEYWDNLAKKITKNIDSFCKKIELRILRLKGLLVGLLCLSCLILAILKEYHRNQEIVKNYHLYKDLPVIEKLDELQELCAFQEDGNE
ncbi:MAG: zf-HC2 domain-containing protein [Candidatus Omnitrophica bacterium]|nr:zf-HC2 domain-containing protein [Candidatus Omnitrophota bacterium]